MSDEQEYNGWANYPTWCLNLHLENDRGTYETVLGRVSEAIQYADDNPFTYCTEDENRRYQVAEMLKGWVAGTEVDDGGFVPDLDGPMADLLGYALQLVEWQEIADAWIETAREQVPA